MNIWTRPTVSEEEILFVPIIAGFEREDKEKILRAFPTAEYRVCRIACTLEQKGADPGASGAGLRPAFSYALRGSGAALSG